MGNHKSLDIITLESNRADAAAAVARVLSGFVPFAGAAIGEVLTAIIPEQRIDRIISYLSILSEIIADMDRELLETKLKTTEFADLFEDSLIQASRALTEDRKNHIASLMKNSISTDNLNHLEKKKLLYLLGQLNDAELIILQFYGLLDPSEQRQFYELHSGVINSISATMSSPQEELDKAAIQESFPTRLYELSLTRLSKSGDGYEISPLGRLLLRTLDLKSW